METNTSASSFPSLPSLTALLDLRTARAPQAPAVWDGGVCRTYGELDAVAGAVARSLIVRGVRAGDAVGVLGVRSWESTAAAAGVLRAGAVCVPVDAQYPAARSSEMLTDAGAGLAIVLTGYEDAIPEGRSPVEWLPFAEIAAPGSASAAGASPLPVGGGRTAEDAAYILFTSGTTGRPKPVSFPHRAITRLSRGGEPWCAGEGKRVLQTFGLSFDGSLFETWATLLNGGCLVVAERDVLLDADALGALLRTRSVTHAFMTTSLFHHAARSRPGIFGDLDMVLIGGESMDTGLTRAVLAAGGPRHLVNGYGPTEGGIMVTAQDVSEVAPGARAVSIGRPVAESTIHLLAPDGSLAGPGEEGEILIGGQGVALGYLGRNEETDHAFVTRSVDGRDVRLYRSGDRARRNGDGTLEFLGRVDRQVKIRGFRIELEAIEASLRAHPDVAEAAVVVRGNDGIGKGLSAYVTPADPARPVDPAQLRDHLASRFPAHALPAPLTPLDHFPLTDNGKIDYAVLRAGALGDGGRAVGGHEDPLAAIWARVLGLPASPTTDFFAVGGNSLLAAQAVTRTLAELDLPAEHFAPLLRHLLAERTLSAFGTAARALVTGTGKRLVDASTAAFQDGSEPDFEADARLAGPLPPVTAPAPEPTRPRHVLLTGATGFVGAFLLDRLLRDTRATVHCPVRAADRGQAEHRVHEALRGFGLPLPAPGRVHAYPAELGAPGLGMAPAELERLAGTVDLVVHNAAHVNFLYPYGELRDINIGAVRTLVELAGPRRVPLHYVSTTAILAGSGVGGVRHFDEHTPLSHPELISMGYPETKWVAERLLANAARAGLPVTVYRPYEITGDSATGAWNTSSAICAVFDAIARLGAAPDVPLPLDLVPVDHVADTIVGVATRQPHLGGVLHLTNPGPARLSDMVDRMRAAGHIVSDVSYEKWVDVLLDHVREHPTAPIAPFVPLFVTPVNQADFSVKEMYFDGVFPEIARTRTDEVWPDWRESCPPVDSALLDLYLDRLRADGLLATGPREAV
ncbi:non-ribosomal peptide synthetase [Streptomyces tsukubensis]|uniref:Amino acid adenylation domain-containing protein n=1 Tax=Streptomyces tsukubensis TaxID=83656 RepID=A0A1V4A1Z0_9ACTN|nr:amino acid adenylation domain-containing protein [Streptomyces tsukubensis]OON73836.1 hypothetical protein B1H18_26605 [Streptomyces tsukubensis]QFR91791.1 amino acid adenylation domain-containing protein [Streptomyces tsukubensis]